MPRTTDLGPNRIDAPSVARPGEESPESQAGPRPVPATGPSASAARAVEIELRDDEINARRFEAIVESSDDAIISKNLDGVITTWNGAAERLFGYTAEEMIGKPISVLMPEDRHDDMESILGRIRRGEHVEHYETVRVAKDGRKIAVSLSVSPVKDASGRIVGAAKIARNISDRKGAEAERERLLREAQQGVQLRDVFLSVAGHELRTPLNALQLQLFNLEQTLDLPVQLAAAAKAQAQVDRLAALVGRLLDVARMAAGAFTLDPLPMDLSNAALGTANRMQAQAAARGLRIVVSAPEPVIGTWDPTAIEQVLANLLSNAIKFGGSNPVAVAVRRNGLTARVDIRDQGPGVPEEDRQRIFERFERGVSDRSYGGLGLGLWIAKQIVAAHGGRIGVEGSSGEGATFYFELPLETEGGASARPPG